MWHLKEFNHAYSPPHICNLGDTVKWGSYRNSVHDVGAYVNKTTQIYARILDTKISHDMIQLKNKLNKESIDYVI